MGVSFLANLKLPKWKKESRRSNVLKLYMRVLHVTLIFFILVESITNKNTGIRVEKSRFFTASYVKGQCNWSAQLHFFYDCILWNVYEQEKQMFAVFIDATSNVWYVSFHIALQKFG